MGIGNAFNTALGGLTAFSNQIGYISDNLANTSTVGFKRVDANFQSYVTESTTSYHSPGGVTVLPSYRNNVAGQISSTSVATNFAISGNGYIPVETPSTTSGGVANFTGSTANYTRAGDFSVNNDGYLVNGSGQYLMGLKENTTFSSPAGSTIPNSASTSNLVGVQVSSAYKSMPGSASSVIDYSANFPASVTANATIPTTSAQVTSEVQFYDSLGTAQTLDVVYQKTAANTWSVVSASLPSDSAATVNFTAGATLNFSTSGALSGVTGASTTVPTGDLGLDFTVTGLSDGAAASQTLSLDYGTTTNGTTQYSGSSLDVRASTDTTGKASGTYQSASIDKDGYVVFNYSNGEQAKPYRIPVVTFSDQNKLTRVTGSTFAANDTQAGTAIAQWAGQGSAGTISPSSTEASNVDTADELTQMIVAQRAYSANGKVITTADQMLQDALSWIR